MGAQREPDPRSWDLIGGNMTWGGPGSMTTPFHYLQAIETPDVDQLYGRLSIWMTYWYK